MMSIFIDHLLGRILDQICELPRPEGRGFPLHRQNQASQICDVEVSTRWALLAVPSL